MFEANVSTHWTSASGENNPHLVDHFAAHDAGEDITGTPAQNIIPDPNAVIWRVRVSQETLDVLEACPDCVVLWSQEIVTDG